MFSAFCLIGNTILDGGESELDSWAFKTLAQLTSSVMTKFMVWVTFFGSSHFLVPAYILLIGYYVFISKKIKLAVSITVVAILGNQLLYLVQYIFNRQRPAAPMIQNVTGFSFPSGHSFAAYMFFGILTILLRRSSLHRSRKNLLSAVFFLLPQSSGLAGFIFMCIMQAMLRPDFV